LLRNIQESLTVVGLLALMFCVFFWAGYYVGKSTAQAGGQAPVVVEQPVRVNLAGT
jgi:hypothetical protein